jgi:hypothetical protein
MSCHMEEIEVSDPGSFQVDNWKKHSRLRDQTFLDVYFCNFRTVSLKYGMTDSRLMLFC